VLSIANLKSSAAASSYYEKDDYYAKSDERHRQLSAWFGRAASELGLRGEVDPNDFKAVLEGKLPNGEVIGRIANGHVVHAPGIDMTFSAPKSVSVLAEVGGDERIYKAHDEAVRRVLHWVQDHAVATRSLRNGEIVKERVGQMMAALFQHDTSRNLDPQLHTHCVIANIVKRDDGKWRSAFLGDVFDQKMFLGLMYRTELAKSMVDLGYHIDVTHHDGRFELKEVPEHVVSAYSTRSQEIRSALKEFDYVNAKTAASATLSTRSGKSQVDRSMLAQHWEKVAKEHGFDPAAVVDRVKAGTFDHSNETHHKSESSYVHRQWERLIQLIGRIPGTKQVIHYMSDHFAYKGPMAHRSIRYAVDHLSERSSVFTKAEVQTYAMSYGLGNLTFDKVDRAFNTLLNSGELLKGKSIDGTVYYTTQDALNREKHIISYMQQGQGRAKPVMSQKLADKFLNETDLKTGQKNAARLILTSSDTVVGVQGYAGTGKTYMLQHVKRIAQDYGVTLIGMAPSASAAHTLQKDSGIESQTIHKFLFKHQWLLNANLTVQGLRKIRNQNKNHIFIVDESSLASTKQVETLFKLVDILKTKVVMIGDTKQLDAVEAGKPFAQLQQAKMPTAMVDEIIRQKDSPNLQAAVLSSIAGKISDAFEKIGDNVIEDGNVERRAADLWIKHTQRDETLVLAPSNQSRQQINCLIRNALQDEGKVASDGVIIDRLQQRGLTRAQYSQIRNYKQGDVVIFSRSYRSLGIVKEKSYVVTGKDENKGRIFLEGDNKERISWSPKSLYKQGKVVESFEKSNIELAKGDMIVWKRNAIQKGIINSHTARVKEIVGDVITFVTNTKQQITLHKDDPVIRHIDYAYAVTAHSAQGKTTTNVIAVARSDETFLTNQKTFYVEISRAKHEAIFVVDDKANVMRQLYASTGEKISAMDIQATGSVKHDKPYKESAMVAIDKKIAESDTKRPIDIQKHLVHLTKSPGNHDDILTFDMSHVGKPKNSYDDRGMFDMPMHISSETVAATQQKVEKMLNDHADTVNDEATNQRTVLEKSEFL